jgi:glucokinase
VGGDLYHGAHFCSGEIGHCVLVEDGPRCGCGQRGCFEALAAGAAIAERAGRLVRQTPIPSLLSGAVDSNGRIDPKDVFAAAVANDPLACEVVRTTAAYIGRGLAILINVLNPQKIIIGGGIAKAGECLLGFVRQYAARYTMHQVPKRTEIVLSPDLDNLPVLGAANLIFKRMPHAASTPGRQ